MFGIIGQPTTCFFVVTQTTIDVVMAKSKSMLQIASRRDFFFIYLYIRIDVSCFSVPTLAQSHKGGTAENLENHVQENIGWVLFKTHIFYIF